MSRYSEDLSGQVFGKLTVIGKAYCDKHGWHYKCRCDCGDESIVRGSNLKQNHSTSCGCMNLRTHNYLKQITKEWCLCVKK